MNVRFLFLVVWWFRNFEGFFCFEIIRFCIKINFYVVLDFYGGEWLVYLEYRIVLRINVNISIISRSLSFKLVER